MNCWLIQGTESYSRVAQFCPNALSCQSTQREVQGMGLNSQIVGPQEFYTVPMGDGLFSP